MSAAKQGAGDISVYLIGNAHIDPVWLWPVSEGRAEVLATYHTAINLIREFDGYVFTSGGAVTYLWVQEDDPALFRAIQEAVAAGKWALVNGWWLQPDCNIPGGESFARHALYGQRFLKRAFGKRAYTGYCVDSFGHAGTLPQLLKLGGLEHYVFFRPGPHEKELPKGPFWWESPGGARVLTCRPPLHYNSPDDDRIVERIGAAAVEAPQGLPMLMCFYGVGNHGGGPTRRNVLALREMMRAGGEIKPRFASPDDYFRDLPPGRVWPVVHDDLQHHARGCYTALSRIKGENRRAEDALQRAERLAALANAFCGTPAATEALASAWQEVLFNQFHDILAGTSLEGAYETAWRAYEKVHKVASQVQDEALAALSARVQVAQRERPVMIWNSLAWERTETVHFSVKMANWGHDFSGRRYPVRVTVQDEEGQLIPAQVMDVTLDHNTYIVHLEACVTVPALGARVLYVGIEEGEPPAQTLSPRATSAIENEFYRLELDPASGLIRSLRDKAQDVELLAGAANVPLVIDDPSDTWSHDVPSFRTVVGRFTAVEPPLLIHDGPVRQTLRVRLGWGRSTIVQEITLCAGSRAMDVTMTVDWHEQHKMLKIAFPLAIGAPKVTASAPYGWIERGANGEEEPCQAWVDLSGLGQKGQMGLCLVSDNRYGYDALEGELRLSILRSPIYAFHQPREVVPGVTYHYIDQGEQVVRYQLWAHQGDWRTVNPARRDLELHEPLIAQEAMPQEGTWHKPMLLSASPENIVLTTVKLAEDGERLIVRGYEAAGSATPVMLRSEALGKSWTATVGAHTIWTLALKREGGEPVALNLLEEELSGD